MRTLLFGVIIGLLAVVHSTPVNTVTHIPGEAEDEVIREAVTDGFLVEPFFLPSHTTKSPKINATVQASQQPSLDSSTESDVIEGSAGGIGEESTTSLSLQFSTTTASHARSSASTVLPKDSHDSGSDSSTTLIPWLTFLPPSEANEGQSSVTPDHISASQTTDTAVSSFDFQGSGSGSGDGETLGPYSTTSSSMTSSSNAETSAASSTSMAAFITLRAQVNERKQTGKENEHRTPGWIIIAGFIVGVAALVMLFVAIATRDKWNGPRESFQPEAKANSSNQQREIEMVTFLHKDSPRENGKAAEYTIIPLDELPEKHSSHCGSESDTLEL